MFFVSFVRISLLGEVNRVVTRLITRGVVVLRLLHSGLRSEAGSVCLAPPTTRVIQNLTEDREPTSPLLALLPFLLLVLVPCLLGSGCLNIGKVHGSG